MRKPVRPVGHGVIRTEIERVAQKVVAGFRRLPTALVSDCLNRQYAMRADIKPILRDIHVVGCAVTVQSTVGNNLMSHEAIYLARPGDVLVIDGRGHVDTSIWGGVQAMAARRRKIAAVIVDGAIRDVAEMRRSRFPVFCKGVVPTGPHKGWGDSVNVPIQCGGVPVNPGDLIVGDDDGVVVVPREEAEEVLRLARARVRLEAKWRKAVTQGRTTLDVIGLTEVVRRSGAVRR